MLGLDMLDVAIGVIVVYLLLSFVASAFAELLESYLKFRAKDLERGIRELLQQKDSSSPVVKAFYEHPLVAALYAGGFSRKNLPSYIPSRTFALAALDIFQDPQAAARKVDATAAEINPKLAEIANRFTTAAAKDVDAARKELEEWFNGSMDRVSGWFKRRTHRLMFVIGLVIAAGLNVDSIRIVKYLNTNKAARQAIVDSAAAIAAGAQTTAAAASVAPEKRIQAHLDTLTRYGLPLGWDNLHHQDAASIAGGRSPNVIWSFRIIGWLMTAFAVSLGAPFWFDTLNKIMVIRSTVKPREKSREERSEDR